VQQAGRVQAAGRFVRDVNFTIHKIESECRQEAEGLGRQQRSAMKREHRGRFIACAFNCFVVY
jgi:hypothetical protein